MKKKLLAFLCVIACTLSLAACGRTSEYTQTELNKIGDAESAAQTLIGVAQSFGTEDQLKALTENYAKHETQYLLEYYSYQIQGRAIESELGVFEGLLTTYVQAVNDMGGEVTVGEHTTKISGDDIIVTYELKGVDADGHFTFKFSNDMFVKLKSAEAVAELSFKQNMQKAGKNMGNAGLNTVLGMGVVFSVLILISLIISSFNLFKKKPKPAPAAAAASLEASAVTEELTDDTELVAVIMAAISAYESANGGSADGFVVRSIRRANRRN